MITTNKTADRIMNLMQDGQTKLVVHYWYIGYDCYSFETSFTLDRNGQSLKLNNPVEYPPNAEDPIAARSEVAEQIISHPDIREGYAGYQGEGRGHWQRVYEHKNAPKPLWVTEQWGWDENGQRV